MAKYALFLGCIAPLRYPGIESATRAVLQNLDVDFEDLEGASCCPAPGVIKSFDRETWIALGARNLALAEEKGADIITICNGCYGSLFEAAVELNGNPQKLEEANKILASINRKYNGTTKVRHFAELLYREVGIDKISASVKHKQNNLRAAVHYGCHFLKPSKMKKIDDPEHPKMLDELVEATGAQSVWYKDKQMCCGAGGGLRARTKEVALKMTAEKIENIKNAGCNCIVNICPFCHLQFDIGQGELGKGKEGIPIIHLSQLLAIAFGLPSDKLGLSAHAVPVKIP